MDADVDLLQRWRAGDADAGRRLFESHFAAVIAFFRRRALDPELARDLTQQTFVALLSGTSSPADTRFKAFLLAVAHNLYVSNVRARVRERNRLQKHSADQPSAQTPGRYIAAKQEQHLVAAALRRLPDDDQLLIEMHYWQKLTSYEIADALGGNPNSVRWRLRRARQRLRDLVDEMCRTPQDALRRVI